LQAMFREVQKRHAFFRDVAMSRDKRPKRDRHALNEEGMVLCNPRDKEAAHRAQMEGIATEERAAVTCRKCLSLLYKLDKARNEGQ
jgi:hypothetical protein